MLFTQEKKKTRSEIKSVDANDTLLGILSLLCDNSTQGQVTDMTLHIGDTNEIGLVYRNVDIHRPC